jgi:DNA-binding NtrC family response regulator
MIGQSSAMQGVLDLARRASLTKSNVIIFGEPGAGKRRLARHIVQLSGASGSLIQVNASFLNERSFDPGWDACSGGTLLIQDIENLTPLNQARLISTLDNVNTQEKSDSNSPTPTRIIATTCFDLALLIEQRAFSEELYWLLNTLVIWLPPLRERFEDFPDLVHAILKESCEKHQRMVPSVSEETLSKIKQYSWPGNVWQLKCFLERSLVLNESSELEPDSVQTFIDSLPFKNHACGVSQKDNTDRFPDEEHFSHSEESRDLLAARLIRRGIQDADSEGLPLHSFIVNHLEKQLIAEVLSECEQVQLKTAARLGINRNTLHKKIKEYELNGQNGDSLQQSKKN